MSISKQLASLTTKPKVLEQSKQLPACIILFPQIEEVTSECLNTSALVYHLLDPMFYSASANPVCGCPQTLGCEHPNVNPIKN